MASINRVPARTIVQHLMGYSAMIDIDGVVVPQLRSLPPKADNTMVDIG